MWNLKASHALQHSVKPLSKRVKLGIHQGPGVVSQPITGVGKKKSSVICQHIILSVEFHCVASGTVALNWCMKQVLQYNRVYFVRLNGVKWRETNNTALSEVSVLTYPARTGRPFVKRCETTHGRSTAVLPHHSLPSKLQHICSRDAHVPNNRPTFLNDDTTLGGISIHQGLNVSFHGSFFSLLTLMFVCGCIDSRHAVVIRVTSARL